MVDNVAFAKNLFQAVEDALFFGDRLGQGEMPILMQPGQFLSGNLSQNDIDDMAIQSEMLNECLAPSFLYSPTAFTLSQLYSDILEFKALPKRTLTSDQEAEIDELRNWLANNQALYYKYADRFEDAQLLYDNERYSQDPEPAKVNTLRKAVNRARKDWQIFGKKQQYESKQARVIYLFSGDPTVLFQGFRDDFETFEAVNSAGDTFHQTFLQPAVSEWQSPGTSWAKFTKTVSETDQYNYSKSTNWSGRVSAGWGMFSGSAGASGSKKFTHETSSTSLVDVEFEYLRVRIIRPWIVRDLFGYKFWTWQKQTGFRVISDGGNLNINPPVAPVGECPVISRNLIVARNVRLSANWSASDRTYLEKNLSTSASAGWGPFSVSGSYSEKTVEQKVSASFDGVTIKIDQPQIIAMTGLLLSSPVPSPDPTLPWENDASLPWEAKAIEAMLKARS